MIDDADFLLNSQAALHVGSHAGEPISSHIATIDLVVAPLMLIAMAGLLAIFRKISKRMR